MLDSPFIHRYKKRTNNEKCCENGKQYTGQSIDGISWGTPITMSYTLSENAEIHYFYEDARGNDVSRNVIFYFRPTFS